MSSNIVLLNHQQQVLDATRDKNRVAYYLDMGLGKTFVASEKAKELDSDYVLLVCQKSKVQDWFDHFKQYYKYSVIKYDKQDIGSIPRKTVIIINYDRLWRRISLKKLNKYTLILDESQYIKNEKSKRAKFVLNMSPENIILLSGTPTGGKYEELWTQSRLLGWDITKKAFWNNYVKVKNIDMNGFKIQMVVGYKNVDRLKRKLREHGAVFMKTENVLELPDQVHEEIKISNTNLYKEFIKHDFLETKDILFVGDTTLTKMLYQRKLCSIYNKNKIDRLKDLLESTNDRFIIFYNFQDECDEIKELCKKLGKPVSIVNGKTHDLSAYEEHENSVSLIQYQAGASGLNLQKATRIVYFTLTLSSELFEQSKKRIHRLGQKNNCFYYYLIVKGSIEEKIFSTLKQRKSYTEKLFSEGE